MGSNRKYEEEIEELALTIQSKPELLKMLLRNYDELIKKVYFPERQQSMQEHPFWSDFYFFADELLKEEEG